MENQLSDPAARWVGKLPDADNYTVIKNQLSDPTARWVGKLPDAVNYCGKSTFRPHGPLGRKTPRSNKLQWKINFLTPRPVGSENSQMLRITLENQLSNPTARWLGKLPVAMEIQISDPTAHWVAKLPDAVNYHGKATF